MEVARKGKAKRKHLNAQDLNEQQQSPEVRDALTKPPTCCRLGECLPSTRKKQRLGSPFGRRKFIAPLFPDKNIPGKHPLKLGEPSSFIFSNESSEDEEGWEGWDDAELVSEHEAGEASCSNAAMAAGCQETESSEIDYLEGLTPELFGDDEEFQSFCESEVEPLPDSHYGLLGSSNMLQTPQSCIADLPVEVLRQVLYFIPAQDLFRSVSLVCHQWRNIVMDPTFVPRKKQYFCYLMKKKETVEELHITLTSKNIIQQLPSDHCLRELVVYMAEYKLGEHVNPEDILECVKKHRLFPPAEASIRLRIPRIQECFHIGLEGPNPYAAMAVILLLSENVEDVQDLVSLLSGCMSRTAIVEYLNFMATILLALERNEVLISNRLHYNIYYVLHLMENGPFSVGSSQTGSSHSQLTREQQQILSHKIQSNHVVKIMAFAGTGKTTTLMKYAECNPHLRFLYVAFNNSVACEARQRFPSNVECRTVHSLAFTDVGKSYMANKKLGVNVKPFSINCVLPSGHGGFSKSKVIATMLNDFMASADPQITSNHVPMEYLAKNKIFHVLDSNEIEIFVQDARMIWNKMKDLKERSKQAYYMTHDGYLKLWQLRRPRPCLSDRYDVLFIDEAQDCTPAIMDVLLSQRCGKILVGDPHQQIYSFKGAVNALRTSPHTHIFYLTQSFRFGAEIAYVGATILKVCKKVEKILVGGKQKGGVGDTASKNAFEMFKSAKSNSPGKICVLSRCNVGVFKEAARLTHTNPVCRIHFIGGVKSIGLDKIMDIFHLMCQKVNSIKDPMIRFFATRKKEDPFWSFKKYVSQTEDKELETKLFIVEKYKKCIPELVARLNNCFEGNMDKADFILGTVHKAKGLEFDTVIVNDDFATIPYPRHELKRHPTFSLEKTPKDEWNLLYVAVTRAKNSVVLSKTVLDLLTLAGEYFLQTKMRVTDPTVNFLECCVYKCQDCLAPDSAFTMYMQKTLCMGLLPEEGPLCERCVWQRVGPIAYLMTDSVPPMPQRPEPRHFPIVLQLFF